MGMYDSFWIDRPIPCRLPPEYDPRKIEWQTKEIGCSLDEYRILWDCSVSRRALSECGTRMSDNWDRVQASEVDSFGSLVMGTYESGLDGRTSFGADIIVRFSGGKAASIEPIRCEWYTPGWDETAKVMSRASLARETARRSKLSVDARLAEDKRREEWIKAMCDLTASMYQPLMLFQSICDDEAPHETAS